MTTSCTDRRRRMAIAGWRAVVAALILGVAGPAGASACTLSVSDITSTAWTGSNGRGYAVYDPRRRTQLVTFRLRSQDADCPFILTVAPTTTSGDGTGHLAGPGAALRYDLFKDASGSVRLKPFSAATESEVYSGTVPGGRGGLGLQFVIVLPPEQLVPPGLYVDEIELSLYEGMLGSGILRDRRRVAMTALVPSVAEISFAEGGAFDPNHNSYSLHFGQLHPGDRRTVRLKVRGNGGYRLLLNSQHDGRLRHVDAADDSVVPYAMTVDGRLVDLGHGMPMEAAANAGVTPATGDQYTLEFSIGTIGNASAGDYRDVIDVTVLSLR